MQHIKSIQTWGKERHESSALVALAHLGYLPGLYICQDPGCFFQIFPNEKDGQTTLAWEFGVFGERVVASGHFEGCAMAYRVQHHGPRGGYSETVWADESSIHPTFASASEEVRQRQAADAAALQKQFEGCEPTEDTPKNRAYVGKRVCRSQQMAISPVIVLTGQ